MKLLEKFSAPIFNQMAQVIFRFQNVTSFEEYLRKSLTYLEPQSIEEIRTYILSQQNDNGAFIDRAGNADIYYSLFGYFLTETFDLGDVKNSFRKYVNLYQPTEDRKNIYLFCQAILSFKLSGKNRESEAQLEKITHILDTSNPLDDGYSWFLGVLALFYMEEYFLIKKYLSVWKKNRNPLKENTPASLIAAELVMLKINKRPCDTHIKLLYKYYRKSGGFVALQKSPVEDLLSTAVSLFALKIAGVSLDIIKPDSMKFITSLYYDGGFCATTFDQEPDIEYTFWGLLALASI